MKNTYQSPSAQHLGFCSDILPPSA
jgi:hypothetical protein